MVEPQARTDRLYGLLALAVATAAFALRFKGVWFGYPLAVHPDEGYLVYRALRMIQLGDLNPHFFNYPSLNFYLLAALFEGVALWNRLILGVSNVASIPEIDFFIAGRILVVLISTATVYVTYEMGRRMIHPVAGLAAAALIAPAFLHVSNSFVVTVDSPVALWSSLAALMAVLIFTDGGKRRYYVLSGVFAGLAVGSKYTGLLGALPLVIAHLLVAKRNGSLLNKDIAIGLLAVPITFLLTTPYAVLDYEGFRGSVSLEEAHYSTGHAGAESSTSTSFLPYAKVLALEGYGVLPMLLSLAGALWLSAKDYRMALILLSFPLCLFLFVGQYKVFFVRNLVAVVPFLALCGGIFLCQLLGWLKHWVSRRLATRWCSATAYGVVAVLLCVSVCGQLVRSYRYVRHINLPDTRVASLLWITKNLPPGSRIGREHYTPPVEKLTDDYEVVYLGY